MTSKEIGRELGISPRTVEVHLEKAMQTLGVATRIEAARLLLAAEKPTTDHLRRYPLPLVEAASDAILAVEAERRSDGVVREEPAHFALDIHPVDRGWRLPFRTRRRPFNELTITERLLWMALIGGFCILVLAGLSASLVALRQLLPERSSGTVQHQP
jgi:hypothetical protein